MRRLLLAACVMLTPIIAATGAYASSAKAIAETAERQKIDLKIATTADALGMIRLNGQNESLDLINRFEWTGKGTTFAPSQSGAWAPTTVSEMTYGVSLHIPAARGDMTLAGPGGATRREIHVVRENLAWNETAPGVGGTAVPNAADRARQILLLPHGFMRAVLRADPKDVKVSEEAGKPTYTVMVNGIPVKGVMGADMRPERVEMPIQHPVLGATVHAANYTGYKDWEGYEVFFPSRIVQTLGGKTSADIQINKYMTGVYLAFPIPPGVAQPQQANR